MAEIGVIGAGSWGTALAVVLAHNGHQVTVWSILEEEVEMLTREHEHKDKLPDVKNPGDSDIHHGSEDCGRGKRNGCTWQYRHPLPEVQHIIWLSLSQRGS